MSTEYWWNHTDRYELKYSKKSLHQRNFILHNSHMSWSGLLLLRYTLTHCVHLLLGHPSFLATVVYLHFASLYACYTLRLSHSPKSILWTETRISVYRKYYCKDQNSDWYINKAWICIMIIWNILKTESCIGHIRVYEHAHCISPRSSNDLLAKQEQKLSFFFQLSVQQFSFTVIQCQKQRKWQKFYIFIHSAAQSMWKQKKKTGVWRRKVASCLEWLEWLPGGKWTSPSEGCHCTAVD